LNRSHATRPTKQIENKKGTTQNTPHQKNNQKEITNQEKRKQKKENRKKKTEKKTKQNPDYVSGQIQQGIRSSLPAPLLPFVPPLSHDNLPGVWLEST
jgi:hypothetical protein